MEVRFIWWSIVTDDSEGILVAEKLKMVSQKYLDVDLVDLVTSLMMPVSVRVSDSSSHL